MCSSQSLQQMAIQYNASISCTAFSVHQLQSSRHSVVQANHKITATDEVLLDMLCYIVLDAVKLFSRYFISTVLFGTKFCVNEQNGYKK